MTTTTPKRGKRKVKKIKAWGIMTEQGKLTNVIVGQSKREIEGWYEIELEEFGYKMTRATITYTP